MWRCGIRIRISRGDRKVSTVIRCRGYNIEEYQDGSDPACTSIYLGNRPGPVRSASALCPVRASAVAASLEVFLHRFPLSSTRGTSAKGKKTTKTAAESVLPGQLCVYGAAVVVRCSALGPFLAELRSTSIQVCAPPRMSSARAAAECVADRDLNLFAKEERDRGSRRYIRSRPCYID